MPTPSIVHLLESDVDFQTRRCAHNLAAQLGPGFEVQTRHIGAAASRANPLAVGRTLRRQAGASAIIHAWGRRALLAAALAGDHRIVFSPTPPFDRRALRWLRAAMHYRDVQVVCPTATVHRACVEAGVEPARCHLIRPAVEFARLRKRNPELRRALGCADDDTLIVFAGPGRGRAALRCAVWTMTILHFLDKRYKLLPWSDGRAAVTDLVAHLGEPGLACDAQERLGRAVEFEELLSVADLALVIADDDVTTLPVSITMAAALPIVAVARSVVGELLEDRHTAMLVGRPEPRPLAQRILDLLADKRQQWQLADMARTEAYEYVPLTRFLQDYRAVYRQIDAADPVRVPDHPPGAGLRFHGAPTS